MNNNWEQLIRAIVPLSFLAIWALTSLFNREAKPTPNRAPGPPPGGGPRGGVDPPLRWSNQTSPQPPSVRRVPIGDDDILIIPSDPRSPSVRAAQPRPGQVTAPRRAVRGKPVPPPAKKVEPQSPPRTKLAGVSQNVNQQIGKQIELAPLTATPPVTTREGAVAGDYGLKMTRTAAPPSLATVGSMLADPARLREAFIVNELLQPPVALRGRPFRRHRAGREMGDGR